MSYAQRWLHFWSLVGAAGVSLSFLVWHPQMILLLWVPSFMCATLFLALLDSPTNPEHDLAWLRIIPLAALVALGVVADSALAVVSGFLAAATLTLVATVSSPWVTGRISARARHAFSFEKRAVRERTTWVVSSEPPLPSPQRCASALRAMSNQALCHEWRHTFVRLQSATNPQELMGIVVERQAFLDEMDRRSPSALRAWLASGARAAGGPDRFLKEPPRPGHSQAA
jgi:hypothetical protein